MKKTIFLIILTALFMFPSQSFCQTKLLKFALLAPEGSTWSKVMHSFDKELRKKTSGRVGFKFYEGAILGDERDVIRKMRIGQVHAAGFTGLGLGLINPNVRVLELPMLVETYAEADAVRNKLKAQLETGFLKKGFEMLGWSETGFVYILSNKPISSRKDMSGVKMWAWEGDQLVETLYKAFNIVPIPTSITEVLTSLQTHLIDGVYAPPLAAIALQWYTQTKYMTDLKLSDSTGGVLVTKRALNLISPADRKTLKKLGSKYSEILLKKIREDNDKSFTTLIQAGLKLVKISDSERQNIRETCKKVWSKLAGKLYSQSLLDTAISTVDDFRKSKK